MSQAQAAIADLEIFEGWRPFLYDDATGKPILQGSTVVGFATIGHGFCVDARRGRELPRSIGDAWLRLVVNDIERELMQWPAFPRLRPEFQRALLQMAYQMGAEPFDGDGLRDWRNMLAAMERGDRAAAAAHALDSTWAKTQTPARALRVAAIIRGTP